MSADMSDDDAGFPAYTVYDLRFDEPGYAGLRVRAVGCSIGELLELDRINERFAAAKGPDEFEAVVQVRNAFFADRILSWNLRGRDGQPVPITAEGMTRQAENRVILRVLRAWREAQNDVPAPLEPGSSGGAPSLEESMPMEVLSPSLAS